MEAFSIAAALATAVQAVTLIVLHLLPTGYNPVRDAVSDYGVGPYRGWFWLQAVAGGLGCLALGIALAELHPFTPTQVVVALIVTAGARFLIPFFATDQQGNRFQTLHGTVHMILAVIAFGGLVWAATGLWSTLRHYPAWNGAEGALTIILDHARQRHRRRARNQEPAAQALLRGLRAPLLPVLDHLGPHRRDRSGPDLRLRQVPAAV